MKMKNKRKITMGIFGFGNMGRAIFKLLKNSPRFKSSADFLVFDAKPVKGVKTVSSSEVLFGKSQIVFLCIKPLDFYKLNRFNVKRPAKTILISIMAGVKMANIKKIFPAVRLVRAMPNLALQAGQGVVGWHFDKSEFKPSEIKLLKQIFLLFGFSLILPGEKMIDALTAVAGSGPAYVFLFADVLIKSAKKLGFSQLVAEKIVMQTIIGSIIYARSLGRSNFTELIKMVKSPGGTTEAAFNSLSVKTIYKEWQKAITRAYRRAQEISAYELS